MCQGLWEAQCSDAPVPTLIFQEVAKGHAAQTADGPKTFFCVTNEFVDNEYHSLTSRGQGLWIHAWRLSATLGYRLSFISLLSVKLISRDNKGTIPLWQHESSEWWRQVFVWTDPSVSACVCVCVSSAIRTSKCFENKLVSQCQHPVVYLKICLSFIYELPNWKLKLWLMYHQVAD